MKVAFILPKLANKGPVIVAKDIIDNIKTKVELIDVYYFDDVKEISFDCNVIKINFFDKIDFDKYDVVHSHMLRPDLYVWFHKKKKNSKTFFVSTLHQNIYDNLKGDYNSFVAYVFERLWLFFLRKHNLVVTLTDVMKNIYSKKTNLNFKTIYNGRNITNNISKGQKNDDFDFLNELKLKYKIIGSHCLLTKRKGINQIIESLVILNEFALVVIGDGQELNSLKKLAIDLGVLERCFFLGYKTDAVVYLKYFDLYVMSSYSEGFPLGLLEAALNKLAVVCSDIPIFRELFPEDKVCFFELDNKNSLAEAVRICYNNKELLSDSINKLVLTKYSIGKMTENYLSLYSNRQ